jgi:cell division protein FtsB
MQRKANEKDIRVLKTENDDMERNVDSLRKFNEKLAKAIRRVKDEPGLVEQVNKMTE